MEGNYRRKHPEVLAFKMTKSLLRKPEKWPSWLTPTSSIYVRKGHIQVAKYGNEHPSLCVNSYQRQIIYSDWWIIKEGKEFLVMRDDDFKRNFIKKEI